MWLFANSDVFNMNICFCKIVEFTIINKFLLALLVNQLNEFSKAVRNPNNSSKKLKINVSQ